MAVDPITAKVILAAVNSKPGRYILGGIVLGCAALGVAVMGFPTMAISALLGVSGANANTPQSAITEHAKLVQQIQTAEDGKHYIFLNPDEVGGNAETNVKPTSTNLTGYIIVDSFDRLNTQALQLASCVGAVSNTGGIFSPDTSEAQLEALEKLVVPYFSFRETAAFPSSFPITPSGADLTKSYSITKVVTVGMTFDVGAFERAHGIQDAQAQDVDGLTDTLAKFSLDDTASHAPGNMAVSENLYFFLENHEGYDPVQVVGEDVQNHTIGYGHVVQPNEAFTFVTPAGAETMLKKEIQQCAGRVNQVFGNTPLTQYQFDALVSLDYNLGDNIWSRIQLTKDVKASAVASTIQADFLALDKVNGVVSKGLQNRREAEYELFEFCDYTK